MFVTLLALVRDYLHKPLLTYALIDYWKVFVIGGTYFGEPQPAVNEDTHAAADADEEMEDNAANTNNNADTDSEDDQFLKKHSKSSKYFVTPRPPTSQLVLVVYGDLGKTGLLPLTAENPQDVSFEPGQADEFKVSGRISHLVIYVVQFVLLRFI